MFGQTAKPPQTRGLLLVTATLPVGKAKGAGYVEGMGIGSRNVKIYKVTANVKRWPFPRGDYLMIMCHCSKVPQSC